MLLIFLMGSHAVEAAPKPNIVFMIADDCTFRDLGCYGGVAKTPNIDKLAENGYLFTDFYAGAPNCSPSRAALLTGINPSAVGMYNYRADGDPIHLRDEEITIAEVLKEKNYQTAYFGKWHLGSLSKEDNLDHPFPIDQGFDYFFGTETNAQPSHLNPVNFIRNGKKLSEQKGYSCQIIADDIIKWLENKSGENPYFLEVAFHEPHKKVASPENLIAHYPNYTKADAEYLANVENLDLAVGRIYKYLEKTGQLKNTFILFTSDNGSYRDASNGELKGVKSYVYEGGIRVPGIVFCPKLPQKGVRIHEPAGVVDIFPTLNDITDANTSSEKEMDGTSIFELLEGKDFKRTKPLFWFFYRTSPEIAMRIDDMMIMGKDHDTIPRTHSFTKPDMEYIREITLDEYELYDLTNDIKQSRNIFDTSSKKEWFKDRIDDKLNQIQADTYIWKDLPEAVKKKKIKTNWVKLPVN